ncbi:MAG: tRNA threonylcarbamoyladenosine dehydratase [Bacilli bacterium]|nr:tRNA threonylcarbamoyladenosine dehydratase [Bacilli bacterium]
MSNKAYSRTIQIIGEEKFAKLSKKKIIIFGVGGVGGQALEALVRSGFNNFTIVDHDVVEESNLNRQLISTMPFLGQPKVEAAKKRMLEINANCTINAVFASLTKENIKEFRLEDYDFIVDAIDSFEDKMALIIYSMKNSLPLISAMGAGNRLDPTKVHITTIEKTEGCPLAKKVRYVLRQEGLKGLVVVTSNELPLENKGIRPGSSPFVPPAYGLAIASYIFKNVIDK